MPGKMGSSATVNSSPAIFGALRPSVGFLCFPESSHGVFSPEFLLLCVEDLGRVDGAETGNTDRFCK